MIVWREGAIGIPDGKGGHIICHYWIKVYDKPSAQYGIEGGRISKLMIKIDGKITANYDRGWDVHPTDKATETAIGILLLGIKNEGAVLKSQLTTTCTFRDVWEVKGDNRYPESELCYIRAYHDGGGWCMSVFPVNWNLKTKELTAEADEVFDNFKKAFPDLEAVREYVEHDAEPLDGDPAEGNAYLELEHGRYWLRLITRKGDYNLYLHVLSKAAMAEAADR